MAAVSICSIFGAPQNKVCHRFHCFPIYLPWSDGDPMPWSLFSECWVSSQLFHSPLSPTSRGSLVPLHFMPLEWYHLHVWDCWYSARILDSILCFIWPGILHHVVCIKVKLAGWQYTALTYSFPNLEPVCCSMSHPNCFLLTCIQVS